MRWTLAIAQNMYDDCEYHTLDEVAKRYNAPSRSNVRRTLTRYGFPSVMGKRKKRIVLSEADMGYIAGILDGEGYIDLRTRTITISNTCYDMLLWHKHKLGGYLGVQAYETDKWRRRYVLRLGIVTTRSLLPILLPYLIVKRDKAKKLIANNQEHSLDGAQ